MSLNQDKQDFNKNSKNLNNEIDFRELLPIIIDGRYIIFISLVIAAVTAFLYLSITPSIYKANGLILVEEKSTGVPGINDMTSMFGLDPSSATEIHVIKSRFVMGKVVEDLDLTTNIKPIYFPLIGKYIKNLPINDFIRKLPFGSSNYAIGNEILNIKKFSVPKNLLNTKFIIVYEGKNKFSLLRGESVLLSSEVGVLSELPNGIEIMIDKFDALEGARFEIFKSPDLNKVLQLQNRVSVQEKGRETGVIEVSILGSNKEKIIKIIDSVSANYYLQNIERMAEEAKNSLAFLDEQIPLIQERLKKSEEELNSFRSEQSSVDLSLEAKSTLEGLASTEAEISTMLINEAEISRRFTSQHPTYISFMTKLERLEAQKKSFINKIEDLPDTQKRILQLQRDFDVNQAIFIALENKRQELSILKASTVGNVRIIDNAAVLPQPVAPRKNFITFASIIIGLVFGLGIVFIRHFFNQSIKNPKTLSDNGFVILATIPRSEIEIENEIKKKLNKQNKKKIRSPKADLLSLDHPADLSVEALRSLRTSLHFSMLESENNHIMISSANPNAGKSFIISNLATVIAQTNKKVLLIDADMRKGYLHERFGLKNKYGLSDILASDLKEESGIQKTQINGLDIVTRGKIPPNPSELLMSKSMTEFLSKQSNNYDYVIFDTPPILAVTDPAIIGRYCGTSIMVSRYSQCSLKQIKEAENRFNLNGIEIKGMVFNAIEKKSSSYYYDYGYYSYEYKS